MECLMAAVGILGKLDFAAPICPSFFSLNTKQPRKITFRCLDFDILDMSKVSQCVRRGYLPVAQTPHPCQNLALPQVANRE